VANLTHPEKGETYMNTYSQDYEMRESASRVKPVLSGLVIGGLIGAGAALLFAPHSGDETRAEIRNKTMELRDQTVDTVKDKISLAKSKASQITSDVKDKARELKQQGQDLIGRQLDRVSETTETKKKAIQGYE
jgi:gas vesicle protein